MNQCWNMVNLKLRNKFQLNLKQNSHIFFQENAFENVIGEMVAICLGLNLLTHWGRVTHICVGKLTTIGSDNGLSPERRQAIIWTNAGILLIGPLGPNFSEILIEIQTFSMKKIRLKMSPAKCCSFRLGLNGLSDDESAMVDTVACWMDDRPLPKQRLGEFLMDTTQGLYSLRRCRLISIGIPIIKLRRSLDRLRFIMGIPIPVRRSS